MIILKDVHKRFRTGDGNWHNILNGVTLTIPNNTSVGLIGKNGAGKSTLLKLIGGVDVPSSGSISRDCRISWPMGFGGGLQGSLTGRQNAKFVCRIHGHQHDLTEKIAFMQDFAEIGEAFDRPVNTYSSGMRSRLLFAMSLAFDFDVYISDEVTAVGDEAFKQKAKQAFKDLVGKSSIIMVAHAPAMLKEFCQAGIWLNEGKAIWFDKVADAIHAYQDCNGLRATPPVKPSPTVKTAPAQQQAKGNGQGIIPPAKPSPIVKTAQAQQQEIRQKLHNARKRLEDIKANTDATQPPSAELQQARQRVKQLKQTLDILSETTVDQKTTATPLRMDNPK